MIPKIIHYCWFSYPPGQPFPPDVIKCIDSWKKYMPDYEIKLWNTENFDLSICPYAMEAYQERKFAFASDYVRMWALYNFGGVYFDTDVEVLKNIDPLLDNKAFTGFEVPGRPAAGVLACEKGNPIFKELLDCYKDKHFIISKGFYDLTANPEFITETLFRHGLQFNNSIQKLDYITVYPREYFYPIVPSFEDNFTENTYAIHHYSASWLKVSNKKDECFRKDYEAYKKLFGKKLGYFLVSLKYGGIKAVPYLYKRYVRRLTYLLKRFIWLKRKNP